MKKILLGLVGVVVALIVAALVVPSFLDWNQYKAEIAKLVESATGRKLDIRGNVSLAVLPAPALSVADVRLANAKGAKAADMVRLNSLEVHVALLPLIGGHVQISSVKLVKPVIELETLADGRVNWEFQPPTQPNGAKSGPAPAPGGGTGGNGAPKNGFGAVQVDHFSIEKGTLVYRDIKAGTVERIENINGRASLASLTGPIDASGSAVVRGIPLSFDGSMGAIIQGRTVPLSLDVKVIPGDVAGKFNGALVNLTEAPGAKGTISLKGRDLGGFVAALTGAAAPPQIAGRRFGISAAVNASEKLAEVRDLELSLDGMTARGTASAEIGKTIDAEVDLAVGKVDLDRMLASKSAGPAPDKPAAASQPGRVTAPIAPAKPSKGGEPAKLPKGVNAAINLKVDALTYQKIAVRQARLSATLANGEITLSQFSALLPGGTDVAAFGFVTLPKGEPRFEGDVEVRTNDLRGALDSFGIEVAGIAPERLHQLEFKSQVQATAGAMHADKIDLKIDGTRVTGTAAASLGARPSVTANINVDKINLDAYLPQSQSAAGKPAGAPGGATPATPPPAGKTAAANDLPFDATIKADVKSLTFQSVPVHELRLDGALKDGTLTLRSLTVQDAAGIALAARGAVSGLAGGLAAMTLSDFAYDIRSNDVSRAVKLAGIALPVPPQSLGKVTLSGTASGDIGALQLDTKLAAASGEFSFAGKVHPLNATSMLNGRVAVRHPDVNKLLRTLAITYRPAGKIGAINAAAKLVGGPTRMDLTAIDGTIGETAIKGAAAIDLSGAKPSINASLGLGVLDITPLLPAKQTASLEIRPRLIPAAWQGGPLLAPRAGRDLRAWGVELAAAPWTREPIDISVLGALDAVLKVNAQALIYDNIRLDGAVVDAALQGGVFDAKRFSGTLYGGQMAATGRLAARGADADLRTNLSLHGTDLGALMRAMGQGKVDSGRVDFDANLAALGRSSAALVSTLNGQGRFAITGARGGESTFLSGFLGLMGALNHLVPVLGSQKSGATDVSGTFQIANGLATSQDLKLASSAGNGTAAGSVSLPAWTIDAKGEIKLAAGLVSILLVDKVGVAPALPFTVRGALDDPKYTFDISKLPGRSLKIPGLDKLRKTPGVGQILNQLLPTGEEPSPVPAPSTSTQGAPGTLPIPPPVTTQPQQQQQPQPTKPKDILNNLLRNLGR